MMGATIVRPRAIHSQHDTCSSVGIDWRSTSDWSDRVLATGLPLEPGTVLSGRYRINGLLGRGGMGEVHDAYDLELEVGLAVKVIKPAYARSKAMLRGLKREVLLARSVTHRHVCRIFDLGSHVDDAGTTHFITMELLVGESLSARVDRCGRLSTVEALPLARQMAKGLAAAHRSGIVHRDFKSGNVMLVASETGPRAVVTDFGVAELLASRGEQTGAPARLVGTPAYMAPEQVLLHPAGPASDIYSLGIVLYEMVTGELPFVATRGRDAVRRHPPTQLRSPRDLVPELCPTWEKTILRCLERDPNRRFETADDVVQSLAGEDAIELRSVCALPGERNRFVGRVDDQRSITSEFDAGVPVVSLVGPAGVGKTRMAVHYGRTNTSRFAGGVWFCDLTEAQSIDGIASTVAQTLDVPIDHGDPIEEIGRAIAGRGRALVILDNFEQVADLARATVGAWNDAAPQAQFLITSRARLRLDGESVRVLDPLPAIEGVELFADRARAARPGFRLHDATRATVQRLVELLEGLPLAIELAAARVSVMTPDAIAERIRDRFKLLSSGRDGGRHGSLRAAIDVSWEMLTPDEQAAFAQISLFEGGFTLDAAEAVIDVGESPDRPWAVDILQALVDKSLLRAWVPDGAWGTPRFGMYVSQREYAREKLRAWDGGDTERRDTERRAVERHGRHYAQFGTAEAREALKLRGGIERLEVLGRELDNLVVATRRAIARGDGWTAVHAFGAAWEIFELEGPLHEIVKLGDEVLAIDDLSDDLRGCALRDTGRACWRAGKVDEARARYEMALLTAIARADSRAEASVRANFGTLCMAQGLVTEAADHFERTLRIHRQSGARMQEGIAIGNLAVLSGLNGKPEEARRQFELALAIHREVGNLLFEGIVLGNLGSVYGELGQLTEARRQFEGALAIYGEVGAPRAEGTILANIAILKFMDLRYDDANEDFERALSIHRAVGNRHGEALVHGYLGALRRDQQRLSEAHAAFLESVRLLREVRDVVELGKALCELGQIEASNGEHTVARSRLDEARNIATDCLARPESDLCVGIARLESLLVEDGAPLQPR